MISTKTRAPNKDGGIVALRKALITSGTSLNASPNLDRCICSRVMFESSLTHTKLNLQARVSCKHLHASLDPFQFLVSCAQSFSSFLFIFPHCASSSLSICYAMFRAVLSNAISCLSSIVHSLKSASALVSPPTLLHSEVDSTF